MPPSTLLRASVTPAKWVLDGSYRGEHTDVVDLKLATGDHKLRVRTDTDEVRIEFTVGTSVPAPAPTPAPAPSPAVTPAAALNIGTSASQNHFSLQVAPTGASSIKTVTLAELQAGYQESPYFTVTAEGNVRFWTRLDAPTTSGSNYPRCELREVDAAGSKLKFDALKGKHRLSFRLRPTHLPPNKPEVVLAQLHDGDADRVAVRTQLIGGVLMLVVRINGKAVTPRLDPAYVAGRWMNGVIELDEGHVSVYHNGELMVESDALVQTVHPDGWYWKAGLYAQSNETIDSGSDYVSVEMAPGSLICTHE